MDNHFSPRSRLLLSALIAFCLILFATQSAQAVSINNQGTLPADQTVDDDLLIGGEDVVVNGTVNGLVMATGRTVTVDGVINGDLFAFGQQVVIGPNAVITGNVFSGAQSVENHGRVDGSFFAGAMTLKLSENASIARNLFFGGYDFSSASSSSVGRDFFMGGYQALIDGSIGQNVNIDGGAIQVNGSIGGDANFTVEASQTGTNMMDSFAKSQGFEMPAALPAGLSVGPEAKIIGKLTYTSPVEYQSAIQSQPGSGVVYQTPQPGSSDSPSRPVNSTYKEFNQHALLNTFVKFIRNFFVLALVGLLLVWLAPKLLQKTATALQNKPLQSAGVGVLSILIAYPGAFILSLVLIGLAILFALLKLGDLNNIVLGLGLSGVGVTMAAFTTLLKFVSKAIVAFLVGDLLIKQLFPTITKGRSVWAMLIGVFLYALISIIPLVGWIVSLLVTLAGLGAIWYGLVVKSTPPVLPEMPQA